MRSTAMVFRFLPVFLIFATALSWPSLTSAQMSSLNYKIEWDTVNAGGGDSSSSSSYLLRDTINGNALGGTSSASYQLNAGYRAGVNDQLITFELFAENPSISVDATALAGTTVTVTSSSGFAVGDFAAVVQDVGASQVAAIGKITSTSGTSITFDRLTNGGVAPVIDGTNDKVFLLSGTSAPLGSLNSAAVATELIGFNVSADVDNGYTIQAMSDGDLRDGSNVIAGVTDGTVSAGSAEYGGRSSDTTVSGSTFGSQDTAFTTSFQPVVSKTGHQFEDRDFVTLKASDTSSTPSGTYSQALTFVVSGNY